VSESSDPFAPSADPDIPTPTREDLLRLVHGENSDQLAAGSLPTKVADTLWADARRQWDEGHKQDANRLREEKSKEAKPHAGGEEWYSDDPNDVSWITGRRRKFIALRVPADKSKKKEQEQLPLSTGTRVVGQVASETADERRVREQQELEAEVVAIMPTTHRDKYNDPNTPETQRTAIFQTYKEKLDERRSRDEAEFNRKLARVAEAHDWLQRIKGDPSKAHIPLPADESEEELLKWHSEMSQVKPTVPHANPSEQYVRRDRMWRDIQATGRAGPQDIAEEEAEAERYRREVAEARERKRKELEAEFGLPERQMDKEIADIREKDGSETDAGHRVPPPNRKIHIWTEIKTHRGWYIIAFLLSGVPVGIATIWPTLTDKKVPQWLAEHGLPRLTTLVLGWVAVVAIIALVIVARSCFVALRNASQDKDSESH
jgi:hypothetical protein